MCIRDSLCTLAAEAAARRLPAGRARRPRVVELTAGSGLVGFSLLADLVDATLLGVDIDPDAPAIATANARRLGLDPRSEFRRASIWDADVARWLRQYEWDLLVCNPPYIPEPPGTPLALEAGSGPDGDRHLLRVVELVQGPAGTALPAHEETALALSWCSLSDPGGVVRYAEERGYVLSDLFVVAIADGEYSGAVYEYLRTLPHAYLASDARTVRHLAPDGAATFGYLLMAGAFRARLPDDAPPEGGISVEALCRHFARGGLPALGRYMEHAAVKARNPRGRSRAAHVGRLLRGCWVLDRWDELALRVMLHGPRTDPRSPAPRISRPRRSPRRAP